MQVFFCTESCSSGCVICAASWVNIFSVCVYEYIPDENNILFNFFHSQMSNNKPFEETKPVTCIGSCTCCIPAEIKDYLQE